MFSSYNYMIMMISVNINIHEAVKVPFIISVFQ